MCCSYILIKVVAFFMVNDAPDFVQQGTNVWEKITHQVSEP